MLRLDHQDVHGPWGLMSWKARTSSSWYATLAGMRPATISKMRPVIGRRLPRSASLQRFAAPDPEQLLVQLAQEKLDVAGVLAEVGPADAGLGPR